MAANTKPKDDKPTEPPVAPFTISTPDDEVHYLKLLVYGRYGCGKTHLAGTACDVPDMRDVFMINAEGGTLSLPHPKLVDQVRVTKYSEISKILDFLRLHCKLRDEGNIARLCELESHLKGKTITEPKMYRTLIMDSLTEVEAYCMYKLLGITDRTKLDAEVVSPEWAEYKRNYNMIQRMIRSYRDLPMHVIFTCPPQYTQDQQKRMHYTPYLTGKLSLEVQGFMDMVGFLVVEQDDAGNKSRKLYVNPISRFDAKHRFTSFKKDFFLEPTIKSIVEQCNIKTAV